MSSTGATVWPGDPPYFLSEVPFCIASTQRIMKIIIKKEATKG